MQPNEILAAINSCISPQRMGRYYRHGIEQVELYKWNIALSESLYPLLHIIEVSLRNRLHKEISIVVQDAEWLLHKNKYIFERAGWHWKQKLDANFNTLNKNSKLDEGHLIAALNFGFWTTLLSGAFEHEQFLWPKLKNIVFPMAHGVNIHCIRERFHLIRRLRNRVFHYGSIWHNKNLDAQHDFIIEAITWLDPVLLNLIQIDRFNRVYSSGPAIKSLIPTDVKQFELV